MKNNPEPERSQIMLKLLFRTFSLPIKVMGFYEGWVWNLSNPGKAHHGIAYHFLIGRYSRRTFQSSKNRTVLPSQPLRQSIIHSSLQEQQGNGSVTSHFPRVDGSISFWSKVSVEYNRSEAGVSECKSRSALTDRCRECPKKGVSEPRC